MMLQLPTGTTPPMPLLLMLLLLSLLLLLLMLRIEEYNPVLLPAQIQQFARTHHLLQMWQHGKQDLDLNNDTKLAFEVTRYPGLMCSWTSFSTANSSVCQCQARVVPTPALWKPPPFPAEMDSFMPMSIVVSPFSSYWKCVET